MQLTVSSPKFDLSSQQHEVIERRIRFALSRFDHHVQRVTVRLREVNGPRREHDVHCLIEATLTPRGKVYAELTDETVEQAISRAVDRVARQIQTEFDAKREVRRKGGLSRQAAAVSVE